MLGDPADAPMVEDALIKRKLLIGVSFQASFDGRRCSGEEFDKQCNKVLQWASIEFGKYIRSHSFRHEGL